MSHFSPLLIAGCSLVWGLSSCALQSNLAFDEEAFSPADNNIRSATESDGPGLLAREEAASEDAASALTPGSSHATNGRSAQSSVHGVGLRQADSLGGGAAPVPKDKKLRVFIFMGQSNMTGHGRSSDLKPPYNQKDDRIRIWAHHRWEYLVPHRNFGPETSFAHEMANANPDEVTGIIKVAVGATALAAWQPEYNRKLAAASGDAMKGSLYQDLLDALSAARKRSDFEIDGFVWKQGGKDSRNAYLAATYRDRFIHLVQRMRADLGDSGMPVFVLTYFDQKGIENHRKQITRIRANALPIFTFQANVSTYLPNAYPVFHGRLPTLVDGVHFNSQSLLKLGKMTADAVLKHPRSMNQLSPDTVADKQEDGGASVRHQISPAP